MDEFVVVDIETTGLSKHSHRITELAGVKVKNNLIVDNFSVLVNPQVHIPRFITKLTGISDEMVEHRPPIQKVLPKFLDFIKECPMVAHNAAFDYGFIHFNAMVHLKKRFENRKICTRRLASRLLKLPSNRLGSICEFLRIQNTEAHRALSDANATTQVFLMFKEMMNDLGIVDIEGILQFQEIPVRKAHAWRNNNKDFVCK